MFKIHKTFALLLGLGSVFMNSSYASNLDISGDKMEKDLKNKDKSKKKTVAKKTEHNDFSIEIFEEKTKLPKSIWFIPSDKQFVSMSVVFLDCGTKNVAKTNPSLSGFLDILMKGCGKYGYYEFLEKIHDNNVNINFDVNQDHAFISFWAPLTSYKDSIDLIPLMLLEPKLPKKHFEKMRKDNLNDFKESLNDPKTHLLEAANQAFYPESHPYRSSLKDVENDIAKIKPKDIKEFLKLLSQENAHVVVLGPKDRKDEIISSIENALLKFPITSLKKPINIDIKPVYPKNDIHVKFNIPQSVILGKKTGFSEKDPKYFAKKIAFEAVGGTSMHSLIFSEVREKRGLAYYCYGRASNKKHDNFFQFLAGTRNETREEVKSVINETLSQIAKKGIDKKTFETTKKEILGSLVVDLDSSSKFVKFFSGNRAAGFNIEEIKDKIKKFEKVTLKEANDVCKELFDSNLVFVTIGDDAS